MNPLNRSAGVGAWTKLANRRYRWTLTRYRFNSSGAAVTTATVVETDTIDQAETRSTKRGPHRFRRHSRTLAQPSVPHLTDEAFSLWWKRGVEPPWIGDALERVFASVYELKAGAGHKIADRARDKNLAWAGFSGDAGGDVDSELQDRQHPNPVSQITELPRNPGRFISGLGSFSSFRSVWPSPPNAWRLG